MESKVVRSRGRPRKRVREDVGNVGSKKKQVRPPQKRPVEIRGEALVGRYVVKEFKGNGIFMGKVSFYDSGLYRVDYEDGDCEDLDSSELRDYLIDDGNLDGDLTERRKKLDEQIARDCVKLKAFSVKGNAEKDWTDELHKGDVTSVQDDGEKLEVLGESCNYQDDEVEVNDDSDSSNESCKYESEVPCVPPPELPPSSGTIGIPEEYVPHLFSVYGFLCSFSVQLFLSPFTLDDLVGCLNCAVPNTLLDAIHVALLRVLRWHLESLSSDGCELAAKCLKCIDWAFLDTLTWPIYVVHYLMTMGHLNGDEWKGFYTHALEKDYCSLYVGSKLMVLQILCDDALDTVEIRAEINLREESEVGIDSDGIPCVPPEIGPKRLHPRNPKVSGTQATDVHVQHNRIGFQSNSISSYLKGSDCNGDVADADEDGNGDECRLCGMDGVLLCCDGCPSAYHSRCIGVNKVFIPDGPWYCPECTVSKIGPHITTGTSLKGAETFGVDSYEQMFLGTCNHLAVFKGSVNKSRYVRYYNCNDVLKVLRSLNSSAHHAFSYRGIGQAILKYWELPHDLLLPCPENVQASIASENKAKEATLPTPIYPFSGNGSQEFFNIPEFDNYVNNVSKCVVDNVVGSGIDKFVEQHGFSDDCSLVGKQHEISMPRDFDAITVQNISSTKADSFAFMDQGSALSGATEGWTDRPGMTDVATCTLGFNNVSVRGQKNGVCLPPNISVHGKGCSSVAGGGRDQKLKGNCLYIGSLFKPDAYINHYMHGYFAASAAANMAVLSSEENRVSEICASESRKAMSANVSLQAKAFSLATVRFFWPSTEKKLVEVPRERCSWCLNCKAPVTSKKACLLNQAALNATKAAMKIISGLHLSKNVDSGLYGIAIYTLYLEESLHGLVVGPFQAASYREQWRKQVEQASTCNAVKALLLELEENLRPVAFSGEWIKLVDHWMDETSVAPSTCPPTASQKRGPSAMRNRKHLKAAEGAVDDTLDKSSDIRWWRGGKISKLVFQKETLPRPMLRKAARQGGSRWIPGIHYAEASDIPKRIRKHIWRASVEMSKNASQLALQVRHLDHHVRWGDLVRPEQTLQDGKNPETEAASFKNAFVCDKKIVENQTLYGVSFGLQKHLSSRVVKSILKKEERQDGKEKYWFMETGIPLYLIKEYEENAQKGFLPPKVHDTSSKLQKRQLKAARKSVFSYLARKREKFDACFCASCHLDVLLRVAVVCGACEGYCHKECTLSSTVQTNENVKIVITCKQCYHGKALKQCNGKIESPTSPLAVVGQENQKSVTKSMRKKIDEQLSVGTPVDLSEKKSDGSDPRFKEKKRKRLSSWGLIWKKKNKEDTGDEFKRTNIVYRGNLDNMRSSKPLCRLCHKPYNPHLSYICCESCKGWFHADAVELDESKLPNLVGFKCCRCRRIKSPVCPFSDSDRKKPEIKKSRTMSTSKEWILSRGNSISGAVSEQDCLVPTTPISRMEEDVYININDPLLFSVPKTKTDVEQYTPAGLGPQKLPVKRQVSAAEMDVDWSKLRIGPQKLQVRRQVKQDKDVSNGFVSHNSSSQAQLSTVEVKDLRSPIKNMAPHSKWDVVSIAGAGNLNFEDIDYEPQTVFSFTELLANDGGSVLVDASGFAGKSKMRSADRHIGSVVGVPCRICLQATVAPDLSCRNCEVQIHSHCSPWEELPQGESWKCGSCRSWR